MAISGFQSPYEDSFIQTGLNQQEYNRLQGIDVSIPLRGFVHSDYCKPGEFCHRLILGFNPLTRIRSFRHWEQTNAEAVNADRGFNPLTRIRSFRPGGHSSSAGWAGWQSFNPLTRIRSFRPTGLHDLPVAPATLEVSIPLRGFVHSDALNALRHLALACHSCFNPLTRIRSFRPSSRLTALRLPSRWSFNPLTRIRSFRRYTSPVPSNQRRPPVSIPLRGFVHSDEQGQLLVHLLVRSPFQSPYEDSFIQTDWGTVVAVGLFDAFQSPYEDSFIQTRIAPQRAPRGTDIPFQSPYEDSFIQTLQLGDRAHHTALLFQSPYEDSFIQTDIYEGRRPAYQLRGFNPLTRIRSFRPRLHLSRQISLARNHARSCSTAHWWARTPHQTPLPGPPRAPIVPLVKPH